MKNIKMNAHEINHENNIIYCGKTFMKNASKYGTPEYNEFVGMKRDFPTYKVVIIEPKKAEAKMTFKGLTREFMEVHITRIYGEDSEQYQEFENQKKLSEAYTNPYMYLRRWFAKAYPNWDDKEEKRKELREKKANAKLERAKKDVEMVAKTNAAA